jgi:hypothetical protein
VLRRVLRTAGLVTTDAWLHRKLLTEEMTQLADVDDGCTPADVMHSVFRRTAKTLGTADPFASEKKRWHQEIASKAEALRARVAEAEDGFLEALKMSLVANEIDDDLQSDLTLEALIERFATSDLELDQLEDFSAALDGAERVLFVHDTAGELFFDRLLIEEIRRKAPACSVTSVVRSQPVLGDATREDAEAAGLGDVATVVDPGIDCLGLPLSECSEEFRTLFAQADVVLAKGQAAYQTLKETAAAAEDSSKEVWFLFRVKCPVMARHLAVEIGTSMLEPR